MTILSLNVTKTKELIVDFRKKETNYEPVTIKGSQVEIVQSYDYLGTTISEDLTWSANIRRLVKKAWQRIYHLRKLRELNVSRKIKTLFYSSVIESVLTFGVSVWGGNITEDDKTQLERVIKCAQRIIGAPLGSVADTYETKARKLSHRIMADRQHPLNGCFALLPSRKRLRQIPLNTERMRRSLVPQAISLFNNNKVLK